MDYFERTKYVKALLFIIYLGFMLRLLGFAPSPQWRYHLQTLPFFVYSSVVRSHQDKSGDFSRITPEKGGNPRNLKLSSKLVGMLNEIPKGTINVFTHGTDVWIKNFARQRKRIAFKTKKSRLKQITFHTFRHWKATVEYHKTKDILHVKEILGHKSLNSTMLYTQLINFKDDDYTASVAHSEDEACKLIESGFEFICDFNGNKLFRKLK